MVSFGEADAARNFAASGGCAWVRICARFGNPGFLRRADMRYGGGMDQQLEEAITRFRQIAGAGPTYMALATSTSDARPSVRTVMLAGIVDSAFAFFVNGNSGKGLQLQENPWAGMCFHWPEQNAQVLVDGQVDVLDDETADGLWHNRPRHTALLAWASFQDAGDGLLGERLEQVRNTYADERIPRPAHWLGFALAPHRIEFWSGGWRHGRDRDSYVLEDGRWHRLSLNP